MKRPPSIRARFLLVSLASVTFALALAGLFLISLFAANLEGRIEDELAGHINTLAAGVTFLPDGRIERPAGFSDRRFSEAYGGLYWQIEDERSNIRLRSQSLWDTTLSLPRDLPADSVEYRYDLGGPDGTQLMALERRIMVASPSGTRTLRIVAASDRAPLDKASGVFALAIIPYLAGLAVFLVAASLVQLTIGLRPLSQLAAGLNRLREHPAGRLDGVLPKEFAPVEAALDGLLDAQARALAKARARAGDLAHGLKTPLTILSNDALTLRERGDDAIADEIDHLVAAMRIHVERELARSRIATNAGLRQADANLAEILRPVLRTLQRSAKAERIGWVFDVPDAKIVPVDPHDLRELVGNLLENASKWAADTVQIRWRDTAPTSGQLVVEDDGPGIDPDKIDSMTRRGVRHDEATPGDGIGLSIVREICEVYGLGLMIENRQSTGLRVTIGFDRAAAPRP